MACPIEIAFVFLLRFSTLVLIISKTGCGLRLCKSDSDYLTAALVERNNVSLNQRDGITHTVQ
jgi:hypothetical protein